MLCNRFYPLNQFYFTTILTTTFLNDNYVEKAKSIKVPFTQVFTPDSDSSQVGKISKPQVLEPRRISHIAKKMPALRAKQAHPIEINTSPAIESHSGNQGLARNVPSRRNITMSQAHYWYKTVQFPLWSSRKSGPTNEPSF